MKPVAPNCMCRNQLHGYERRYGNFASLHYILETAWLPTLVVGLSSVENKPDLLSVIEADSEVSISYRDGIGQMRGQGTWQWSGSGLQAQWQSLQMIGTHGASSLSQEDTEGKWSSKAYCWGCKHNMCSVPPPHTYPQNYCVPIGCWAGLIPRPPPFLPHFYLPFAFT